MRPFAVTLEGTASQATVTITGEFNLTRVDDLEAVFEQACHRHPAIITVDLSAAETVDSTGLNAFTRWHDVANRTGFHVLFVQPPERVYEALQETNLDRLLTVERR
jgi:anti-anti-sigma factor